MVTKYVFNLRSEERRRELPAKLIVVQSADEDERVVLQRLFGYLILFRDRIQMQKDLHDDYIPFVPDLVQLDYQLQPVFWAECGECDPKKLNRLAVKIHEGEVWIVRSSRADTESLVHRMSKAGLRRKRDHLLTLDEEMIEEVLGELQARNDVTWYLGHFDPPSVQFEFNGLWFEAGFEVTEF
jgi:uncharacterized protein YaeQ